MFAYQGEPSWLYVTFRSMPRPGHYDTCLVTKDGLRFSLRSFIDSMRLINRSSTNGPFLLDLLNSFSPLHPSVATGRTPP